MASPIYYFTRSGCAWCTRMQPSIEHINKTLNDEQKIQILNVDDKKSRVIYDTILTSNKLRAITPMLYNSNIGTFLLGYQDKRNVEQFLKANPLKERKPLKPIPTFDIQNSSKKDFDNWKKSVILWYGENQKDLPTNVISQERMIDMVYTQFMAYRTKPLTIEERLSKLEEQSHEPQNYREECEKMNKELKNLKLQIKKLKRLK